MMQGQRNIKFTYYSLIYGIIR